MRGIPPRPPPLVRGEPHAAVTTLATLTTTEAQATGDAATSGATRLRGIDALRGAAALAVVLYHAAGQSAHADTGVVARWLGDSVRAVAAQGYAGVFLFFVISGFCIHLNFARQQAGGRSARIEFLPFWRRRLRRLYPAYLVALALSLAVAYVTGFLPLTRFLAWDVSAHLLMLHNFDARTSYSINSVFWTLAIEEQLYLAYFLLLYVRRRWGWARTLALALAARAAWLILANTLRNAVGVNLPVAEAAAVHWFTWALGALAVESAYGLVSLPRWTRDLRVGVCALACALVLDHYQPPLEWNRVLRDAAWFAAHPAWGLGFFVVVNRAVAAERSWRASRSAPRAVAVAAGVGVISYSLYLTHPLVLLEMWRFEWPQVPPLAVALFVMTPLCVAFAWLFYRACERPFLARSGAPQSARAAEPTRTRVTPPIQNLEPKFDELN